MKVADLNIKKYASKSLKQLDAELWRLFSLWIRQSNADHRGVVRCVTCKQYRHWRYVDAGHFMSRRHLSTKFDEKNVYPQCKCCNGFGAGQQYKMSQHINRVHGLGTAEYLERLSKQAAHWLRFDYIVKIEEYKAKLKAHKFLLK